MIQQTSKPKTNSVAANRAPGFDTPDGQWRARWIDSVEELETMYASWMRLLETAVHRNLFLDPDFFIPAFKHFGDRSTRVLAIEASQKSKPSAAPVLCGLIPLQRKKIYGMPLSAMEVWNSPQCVDGTPLLRSDCASEVLEFAWEFLVQHEKVALLSLNTVSNDGAFGCALNDLLFAKGVQPFYRSSWTRAGFVPEKDSDTYFQKHVSSSVQRTQRRLARRLAERGDISTAAFRDRADLVTHFLRLESSGWKQAAGTALDATDATRLFFEEMVTRSLVREKVSFLCVQLNGRPISMLCDLYSGGQGYAYKTAFDDSLREFSPGVMAELENIRYMHQMGVTRMDSCTAPDNQTINRIWGTRLRFHSLVIPLQARLSRWTVALMPLLQQLKPRGSSPFAPRK